MEPAAAEGRASETCVRMLEQLEHNDRLTIGQIHALSMELRTLDTAVLMALPLTKLQTLVRSLEPLLKMTRTIDGALSNMTGTEKRELSWQATESMLAAALLYLDIVIVPGMPHQIFVEEMVEDTLSLCKQQLADLNQRGVADEGPKTPATSRRSSASTSSGKRTLDELELSRASKLALLLDRLPALVSARCLSDSLVLQLAHLAMNTAFGAPTQPLQTAAIDVLIAIFVEYDVHRISLLREMLDVRLQIAEVPTRDGSRTFALMDGTRIQAFSALALLMTQNVAALPLPEWRSALQLSSKVAGSPARGSAGGPVHPFRGAVTECASHLLRTLTSRCFDRPDDADAKFLLEEFVRDMLLVLGRPEWPASTHLVTLLSTILCRRIEKKKAPRTPNEKVENGRSDKDEIFGRLLSLDLLGQILAALAAQRRLYADNPLVFPEDKVDVNIDAQPDDAGEDGQCICGAGYDGTFMLDCDRCHRWFHGACVGMQPSDDMAVMWYCDSCQLSRAVADQRRAFTRLLSLGESSGAVFDPGQDSADTSTVNESAVDALCTEEEVTKQLLLNYLDGASSNPAASSAHRLMLSQWHFDARERKADVLCRLYEEQYTAHAARHGGPADLRSVGAGRRLPLLTRDKILSATRKLLVASPLLGRLETMIAYVLLVLKEPQPSARTKAIKAISGVVNADPSTLEMAGVKQAVHLALCEPSIAVREATLDLIGQYILSRPEFVPLYYEPIVRRLGDVGISVRKRVVRILRELCMKDPSSRLAIDACRRLMGRVNDEDEVQKLVVRAFYELWFMPPSGGEMLSEEETSLRCIHMANVVAGATPSWSDWLRQLLIKLLTKPADGKGMKEHAATLHVSSQLVAQLMEMLLQLHENGTADTQGLGSILQALSLFCAAKPALLVPHVELLPNYLQYDHYSSVLHHVCDMLPKLMPLLDQPRKGLLEKLERLLGALVFRVPEQLLQQAIAALCCTVEKSHNHQLLHETLARLCQMMTRAKDPTQAERLRDQLHRSILCAGLLCRYFDFEAPGMRVEAFDEDGQPITYSGDFTREIFDQLHGFLPSGNDAEDSEAPNSCPTVALYALKAIGHLCVRRHDLLLACRGMTRVVLRSHAPPQLRQQALSSMLELLKQPAAPTTDMRKEAAQQATEASAAVSGTLQQHQTAILEAMVDPRYPAVRREALNLIRAMLEQGLVHPMACIPQLMALELDTASKGCSQTAQEVLRKLYERHHQMVCSPGVAMQGMVAAYRLQSALRAEALGASAIASSSNGEQAPTALTPRFMFELMLPSRKERLGYLKALVGLLHPDQLDATNPGSLDQVVERAGWVAQSLAGLPFEKEEDPLTLVYHINRQLSLHADSALQALERLVGEVSEADPFASCARINEHTVATDSVGDVQSREGQGMWLERCSHSAAMICLLLLLKRYIKQIYQLSGLKCQAFEPSDTSSLATNRLAVRVANKPVLDVSVLAQLPPRFSREIGKDKKGKKTANGDKANASMAQLKGAQVHIARVLWLRDLLQADEAELDYNLLAASVSTPKPKPAKGRDSTGGTRKRGRPSTGGGSAKACKKGGSGSRKRKSKGATSDGEDDSDDADPEYQED